MSQEKSLLLDEFHTLLNKPEISEQISFLENNNEKIKSKIQYSEKSEGKGTVLKHSKSFKLKRKHNKGVG